MSEMKKTLTFTTVAVVLAVTAMLTAPRHVTPDAFLDRGEPFFPDFTDPNAATTLEAVEFDEQTGEAKPFKVTFQEGQWTIPSHHNYPADAKDRLAQTAAGVIGIKKDDFRSDNVADHEACGVVDPLDESSVTLKGRGKRITLRGKNEQVLADFIVGNPVPDRSGLRFVRIPDQKRVYVARMDIDISTQFQDWIEKDLLEVDRDNIDRVVLKDYRINERTRRLDQRDLITLSKQDSEWSIDKAPTGRELDQAKVGTLISAIEQLSIVGVRPKPEGLSEDLKHVEDGLRLTTGDRFSLQSKGYYFTGEGMLVSNEGEVEVHTTEGVTYTLRFGEIVYGMGEAVTAGTETSEDKESGPGENRYLFVTTGFEPSRFPEPPAPANLQFQSKQESEWSEEDRQNKERYEKHEEWRRESEQGQATSSRLNTRFAKWYYVIAADSFEKIRLTRKDLLKDKTP